MNAKLKNLKPVDKKELRRATVNKKTNNTCVVNMANKIREELLKMKGGRAKAAGGRYAVEEDSDEETTSSDEEDY